MCGHGVVVVSGEYDAGPVGPRAHWSRSAPARCSTATTCASTSPTSTPSRCTPPRSWADTSHVVVGESTTDAALYMAMTCGLEVNNAYLYERAPEHEYRAADPGRACVQITSPMAANSPSHSGHHRVWTHHRVFKPARNAVVTDGVRGP